MKFARVRNGFYRAENGLKIMQYLDGSWYIVCEETLLHKCRTLKDAEHICGYYKTEEDIREAVGLRNRGRSV